jgi:hypothetical protein
LLFSSLKATKADNHEQTSAALLISNTMKNKHHNPLSLITTCLLAALCLTWTLSSGCSKSSDTTTEVAQAPQGEPIQGELIQGDPIEPEPAAVSASSTISDEGKVVDPQPSPEPEKTIGKAPEKAMEVVNSDETDNTTPVLEEENDQETTIAQQSAPSEPAIEELSADTAAAKLIEEPLVATTLPDANGYLSVSFDKLASFEYQMPEDLTAPVADEEGTVYKEQIPADIKALNAKNISLKGFMLPLKVEKGLVTEMLIMRDQSMCCYGTVPKINEWVSVRMDEQGVKPIMDEAVTIYGTLQVGEVLENGYLVGIYEMAGQKMDEPQAN